MWARHSGCDSPEYELDGSAAADNASVALSFDGDDIGGFDVLNLDDAVGAAAAVDAAAAGAGGAADAMQQEEEEQL
jgi:hypothetical protein